MKKLIILFLLVAFVFAGLCPLSALAAGYGVKTPPPYQTPSQPEPRTPALDVPLWQEWGFDSLEEFLKIMGMTEEEYYEYEASQRRYEEEWKQWEEEYKQRRIKEFEELGGVYGLVNIMFNGEFIAFSGAIPEIIDNSTFVPAVPFFEAMGAKASYDDLARTIAAEFTNRSLCLVLDQDKIILEENGEENQLSIGLAPYDKDGVPYIPARAVSEALGYDVYWDSEFRTVVILDTKGIIAEIDKDFTIVNKLFDLPVNLLPNDGSAFKTIINVLVSATQFDSLNGNLDMDAKANISIHSDGLSFYLKAGIDLSDLLDYLLATDYYGYYSDEDIREMNDVFNMITDRGIELIYNYDKDVLYARIPFIHLLVPEIPENVWISASGVYDELFEAGLSDFAGQLDLREITNGASVGNIICLENMSYSYYDQIYLYRDMMADAEEYKAWVGDQNFRRSGADYTLTLTQDDVKNNTNSPADYYSSYYKDEFELKLTVRTSNGAAIGATGSYVYHEGYYNYETRYSASFDISAGSVQFSYEVHEKNVMKTRIDVGAETKTTGEPVPQAPPAGADIISIEELFPDQFERPAIVPVLLEMLAQ